MILDVTGAMAILLALQSPLTEAPELLEPEGYDLCECPATEPEGVLEFQGIVQDAELRLGPDGRSVLPEQATVFSVIRSSAPSIADRVKVFHSTKPEDCGLSFDYGKRYRVRVLPDADRFVSNYCLDPRRTLPDQAE
ncbi:MAG: hypothetical protein AAGH38_08710 [Pseudomonadota bacterium]